MTKGVLDIETGGFSITKNGVCEISIIAINQNNEVIDQFYCLIKPYKRPDSDDLVSYKDDAMAVNGILVSDLERKGEDVELAMNRLKEFVIKYNITLFIGHNLDAFDIPRVQYLLCQFIGYELNIVSTEDTIKIAKRKLKLSSYSLEALCNYFGITNTNKHSSAGDTLATLELYLKLISL